MQLLQSFKEGTFCVRDKDKNKFELFRYYILNRCIYREHTSVMYVKGRLSLFYSHEQISEEIATKEQNGMSTIDPVEIQEVKKTITSLAVLHTPLVKFLKID